MLALSLYRTTIITPHLSQRFLAPVDAAEPVSHPLLSLSAVRSAAARRGPASHRGSGTVSPYVSRSLPLRDLLFAWTSRVKPSRISHSTTPPSLRSKPVMAKPRATSGGAAPAAAAPAKTVHSALVTYASMLSLLSLCPPFVILLWYTMVHADGSVMRTYEHLRDHGLVEGLKAIWPMPTMVAWKIIFGFGVFEAALQLLLPGKRFEGPVSPAGNVPVYKANGLQAYAVTLITYLSLWWFGIFNPAIVYDHLGEIYSALVFGSFVFCIFLYLKGHVAPSSSDSGSSGNAIIDFYWGMELYPRIGKHFDIKVFTNCRFGMMSWAVLAVTYSIKQYEMNGQIADSMLVNTALMLIYVTKFFWWESGYWCTMDIAHDRAGFYICWGCLVWVPSIYTSPGMYLVNHPVNLGPQLALSILLSGMLCIYINYDCDRQRQEFRRTNGKCSIWGKAPSKVED
ncbi:hypothetical protein GUJ93_ZPchr0006g46439 [Zizania palustris]|uniref:7-dehydrocholesterol reductase n=1 Tax=Zizania palustris TaxID=103762 RepID=A0A8J5S828_ZIZPA|nr:hypothetical protein GUJ93_ZPchr0006g46439 [Zizania palustris]